MNSFPAVGTNIIIIIMTILNLVIRFFDNNTLLLYRALLAQRFAWVLKISLSLPLAALKDLFHLAFQQTVSS